MTKPNKKFFYADHAATTPLSPKALEAMLPYLQEEWGNPSSLHQWSKVPREAVKNARETIASCIGAEPEEIFFTSGGTESDNWVIKGTSGGLMVSSYEHHAILNAAQHEAERGRLLAFAKPKMDGYLLPASLSKAWKEGVGLVSVMMANNEIGTINPIKPLAEFAHSRRALFYTDAVQAVGHIPIDVKELGIDFMSASAHKFNGPKGIGFLYVRKGLMLQDLLDGGQQEFGARAGTENVASIVGMATALKENCEAMERNARHLEDLVVRFYQGVEAMDVPFVALGHRLCPQLPGFISIAFPGHSGEGLMHILDMKGIAVSTGAACDSKNTQISHVLKAIHAPKDIATSVLRITFGIENTSEEVDALLRILKPILKR